MLPPTPTQHYLVLIRLQRKFSFIMSFTIFKYPKKYYSYSSSKNYFYIKEINLTTDGNKNVKRITLTVYKVPFHKEDMHKLLHFLFACISFFAPNIYG